jgi:CheY-like chemotaxis protein
VTDRLDIGVLVVEDDPDVRQAILEALEDNSYSALGAHNGQEALELLRGAVRPRFVLLDLMMPVMDGRTFRAIQAVDPELMSVPVVVLSAHTGGRELATEMAAAGYLSKPVQLAQLLATVRRYCGPEA